ncbi:MAG: SWIM zinc finger family protein [Chloroflexi bacterium]|nr:SWIM zinc finger family protein [Chloroflexota bacterium]
MPFDYYFKPTKAIKTKDGIKAQSKRGAFAKNWWAQRWIAALERLVDSGRLSRGRSYARKGQVLSIDETKDGIAARVQGSMRTPYRISIKINHLTDSEWDKVIDSLAEQAIFSAQLLAGEMPQEIEQAFEKAKVSLFPSKRGDLATDCSCPDYSNPCKHIAATHYILGERFDEDPFLIFRLRGRTQEQVMQELRKRRAGSDEVVEDETEEAEVVVPLEELISNFWDLGAPLEGFSVSIRPPAIEMPLLKRLGEANFVDEPGIQSWLSAAYQAVSRKAIQIAFKDTSEEA